jgi:hypothetical protein
MDTTNTIAAAVQSRLEEPAGAGIFWSYQNEILPAVVEAMNEASLLTGVVQIVQTAPITVPINTTYLPLPINALALLRVQAPVYLRKTNIFTLDNLNRTWQTEKGPQLKSWFPLGVTNWGVYPQLTAEQQVIVTYLAYPVNAGPPYTGNETVPFQSEFDESLEQYASHILRLKEAGADFEASQTLYQEFLKTMLTLNAFESRHDSLTFTRGAGASVRINPVEVS